jgi:hypothetical protein
MTLRPLTLALLVAFPSTGFAEGPLTDDAVGAIAKRFAASIKCDAKSKDLQRAWCAVTKVDKAAFKAPRATTTMLGLSVELPDGAEVNTQLLDTTSVSALHLGASAVRLTSLKPSNEQEKKDMLPVLFDIAGALKMDGKAVGVTKDLGGFLDGERAKPGYPMTAAGKAMEYTGKLPSRLYQVGAVYVVVESAPKGYYVSVFPAVPLKVK